MAIMILGSDKNFIAIILKVGKYLTQKSYFLRQELDIYIFPRPFDCEIVSNMT